MNILQRKGMIIMNDFNTMPTKTLPPADPTRAWLEHFPASSRSTIANWFHHAVRAGHTTPPAVVCQVLHTAQHRSRWAQDYAQAAQNVHAVLEALQTDRPGALAYAATVLQWESLPTEERERQKQERSQCYRQEYMTTIEPTPKQVAYLRTLGYVGPPPATRAEASAAIDALVHPRQEVQHG